MPQKRGAAAYIGHVLRPLREEKGLTTEALAERTAALAPDGQGLSASYIRNLELNQREPSLSALRLLAAALKVKPRVFCEAPPPDDGAGE